MLYLQRPTPLPDLAECGLLSRIVLYQIKSIYDLNEPITRARGYPDGRVRRPTTVSEYATAQWQIWDHLRGVRNAVLLRDSCAGTRLNGSRAARD
jgi:hypothetical protein